MLLREVLRLSVWLLLLALVFAPLEQFFGVRPSRILQWRTVQDVAFYFISGILPGLLLTVPLAIVASGAHALVPDAFQDWVSDLPMWVRLAAGFVIGEVGFYWGHRWTHQIPFLWRFHAVHHSPEQVYFLVSAHAHPLDSVFVRLCGLIPAYVLGVASPLTPDGTLVPVIIMIVATVWGFFIHSNLRFRLGFIEWMIATPAFHHWHHTHSDHRDRNFASMLPWMDRLFGTHYLPEHWPAEYGTDTQLPSSIGGKLLYPFLPARKESKAPDLLPARVDQG